MSSEYGWDRTAAAAYRILPSVAAFFLYFSLRKNPYWAGATWALVLYVSYLGWGALVGRLVEPRRRFDLGMRASWGIAATLSIGGVAAMLHAASRPFLLGQVVAGCVLAVVARATDVGRVPSRRRMSATFVRLAPYLVVAVCALLVGFEWLGQLATVPSNASDDQALYFYLPEKLVQTGSFFDPYDVRRITSYGGQFYLHAQFLVGGAHYQLNVVDCGIGTWIVFTHIIGMIAPRSLRRADAGHLGIVLLLLLTLFQVRFNIGSLLTGVALGLASYRTLVWMEQSASDDTKLALRRVALLAACTVATCLLRTSNAIAIIPFVGFALLARPALIVRRLSRESALAGLKNAVLVGGFFVAWMLPWLVMFRESVGTAVYPIGHGNITPGFVLLKAESGLAYNLKHLIGDAGNDRPLMTSLLLLLGGLAPAAASRRVRRTYLPLAIVTCFVATLVLSYSGGAFDNTVNSRYYFAFVMWTAIIVAASIPSESPGRWLTSSRGAIIVAAIVVQIVHAHDEFRKRLYADVDSYDRAHKEKDATDDAQKHEWKTEEYRDVQYRLPAKAAIAVAVADPFRFDMKRNPIFSLDQPGGMGPDGGFPVYKGPEVVADYFLKHGVRYLIAMDFHKGNDLYDINRWRGHAKLEHTYLAYEAPIQINAMESIEALESSRVVVYHQFDMFAIDLGTRVAK